MTASIFWEPVNPSPDRIGAWAPSWFMEAMERAGMGLPCTVGPDEIPKLRGLSASQVWGEAPDPFEQIIEKIEKNGKISLWAEQ